MTVSKHVFLSYAEEDQDWAREFADDLAERGLEVWDETQVYAGEDIREATEKALRDADTLIVLISKASAANPSVLFEIGAAIGGGKRLVPVYLTDPEKTRVPFIAREANMRASESPREAAKAVAAAL